MTGHLPNRDLNAEADEALEAARAMPSGQEKVEALKTAGLLRNAVDAGGHSRSVAGHGSKPLQLAPSCIHVAS